MKYIFFWSLFCSLSLCKLISSDAPLNTFYERKVVGNIQIQLAAIPPEGSFHSENWIDQMQTKVGEAFSHIVFDEDIKRLAGDTESIHPIIQVQGEELFITLQISPFRTIRQVTWIGNDKIPEEKLQEKLGISAKEPFVHAHFMEGLEKLKRYYIVKGYFEAQIAYQIHQEETHEASIEINISEGRSGFVDKILLEGFTEEEEDQILQLLHTSTYFFLTSWATGSGRYDPKVMEQDLYFVTNVLRNRGYADARISVLIEESKKGKIFLKLIADRGEQYHIGRISIEGGSLFSEEELLLFLYNPLGYAYSPDIIRLLEKKIEELYGSLGYVEAQVESQQKRVEESHTYDVHFSLKEGKKFRVGMIHVLGNTSTQIPVILHETLLIPGEILNEGKLKLTEQRLNLMGYFKRVRVYLAPPEENSIGKEESYRDVYIELEEKSTGHLHLTLGASNKRENRVFGKISLSEENFNFRGIRHVFKEGLQKVRGGGEDLDLYATIASKTSSQGMRWWKNYIFDSSWGFGIQLEHKKDDIISHKKNDVCQAIFRFKKPLNAFFSLELHYRFSKTNIKTSLKAIPEKEGDQKARETIERNLLAQSGNLSAVGAKVSYDTLNAAHRPTQGYFSELGAELAGLGGKHHFLHLFYHNFFYSPLPWKRSWMKYVWNFDFIQPLSHSTGTTLPRGELLLMGGDEGVRGARDEMIGPKDLSGNAKGALSSIYLVAEANKKLNEWLDTFLFCDVGFASGEKYKLPKPEQLEIFGGVGLRFWISRMPINIGFAYPIKTHLDKKDRKKVFISLMIDF